MKIKQEKTMLVKKKSLLKSFSENKYLYLLCLPGILYLFLFKYLPMKGILMAFQDYNIIEGVFGSPWVGFKHFKDFFSSIYFGRILCGISNWLTNYG